MIKLVTLSFAFPKPIATLDKCEYPMLEVYMLLPCALQFLQQWPLWGGLKSSKIKVSAALRSRHDAGEDGTIVVDYGIIVSINYISTSLD